MIRGLLFFCLCLAQPAFAADFFYRPACASDGDGTGSGCGSGAGFAWNVQASINWGGMGTADTFYLIGTHDTVAHLDIETGGNATTDFTIRGDHAAGAGIFNGSHLRFGSENADWITITNLTFTEAKIQLDVIGGKYSATNVEFVAPDKLRDHDKAFISRGIVANMMIKNTSGENKNNKAYLVVSVTDQGAYEEIIIDSSAAAIHVFEAEGPGSKNIEAMWPVNNITVKNSSFTISSSRAITLQGTDILIQNVEIDGQDLSMSGCLYTFAQDFWKKYADITIDDSYIHDCGKIADTKDAHCIGIQNGGPYTITDTLFENCGSALVFFNGEDFSDILVSRNKIKDMDYDKQPGQWGGSGIVFTNNGPLTGTNELSYNIITNALNCPGGTSPPFLVCLGIRYNRTDYQMPIFGNTIDGMDYGIWVKDANVTADIRNNGITNSNVIHIGNRNTPLGTFTENYNSYFPVTGTKFQVGNTAYNFADYKTNHPQAGTNANSITTDPSLNASFEPDSASDPVVDAGVNLGASFDDGIEPGSGWPTGSGGGTVTTLDQDDKGAGWEIGAFVFDAASTSLGVYVAVPAP